MTIRDAYGRYVEVPVPATTWTQLYNAGLLRNGILDVTNLERRTDNGHYDQLNTGDRHAWHDQD